MTSNGSPYPETEEQEPEEWNREDHIDPAYVENQIKTFTKWCNQYMGKMHSQIENFHLDFRDGVKLMLLLEALSDERLPKPEKGKLRFHHISNVGRALEFIAEKGVPLVSVGAEEIVDGNLKMTLGMIWTIILRWKIQDIQYEDRSAKDGLLLWCQRKTQGYKAVNVQNFHNSWKDGLAFCALIHKHRPDLLDYSDCRKDQPIENLNLAFEVAERHLAIPRMLEAEDIANSAKPDEKCIMTYLSSYYHTFIGSQKAETATSRVCRIVTVNQDNDELKNSYDHLSSDLLEWIARTMPFLEDRSGADDLDALRNKQHEFRNYKQTVKPPRLEQRAKLEADFQALQTRLRLMGRTPYLPADGRHLKDINAAWQRLERAERDFEDWLMSRYQRQQRLHHLIEKFRRKCNAHESWADGKEEQLEPRDFISSDHGLNAVKAMVRNHEAFTSEVESRQPRVEQIVSIADELLELEYEHMADEVEPRVRALCDRWKRIGELSGTRTKALNDAVDVLDTIERKQLEFAKKAAPFRNWLEGAREDLQDTFIVHTIEEIDDILTEHDTFKSTLGSVDEEMDSIDQLHQEYTTLAADYNLPTTNPYTSLTKEHLHELWTEVKQLVPERDEKLKEEHQRQVEHEQMRQEFTAHADKIGPWIREKLAETNEVLLSDDVGTLEDQLNRLKALRQEVDQFKPEMQMLEQKIKQMLDNMIFVGVPTTADADKRKSTALHVEVRDAKGIKPEQVEDFRRSFNHFDRNQSRTLDQNEFKACLLSLGAITDDKKGETELAIIMAKVDPNGTGQVTFDAFLDFMTRETAEEDTAEKLISAFEVMAGDKPYVTESQLRSQLPERQADYCIETMRPYVAPGQTDPAEPGALDYKAFAEALFGETDL